MQAAPFPPSVPMAPLQYPSNIGLDMRKLPPTVLYDYVDHHQVQVPQSAPPADLAIAMANHFASTEIACSETIIGGFLNRLEGGREYRDTSMTYTGHNPSIQAHKRRRSKLAARHGEKVAAKTSLSDENGSWILASVQSYNHDTETYDVQDEDDVSKLIRLPFDHVIRLSDGTERFHKGSSCMAIFPETTSFYKAVVSKSPVWKFDATVGSVCSELILKFMDDEDESGRTPHRLVPSQYVIPLPEHYFEQSI